MMPNTMALFVLHNSPVPAALLRKYIPVPPALTALLQRTTLLAVVVGVPVFDINRDPDNPNLRVVGLKLKLPEAPSTPELLNCI
jgi:hypothetical protein